MLLDLLRSHDLASANWDELLNPFQPNGISCSYQLGQSISVLRVVGWYFFIFIQILIQHSVSKQWRPRSDVAECGIWSGSVLCANVPQKGLYGLSCACCIYFWFQASSEVQIHDKYGIINWMKYYVDLDQLAASEATWSGSTLFTKEWE